MEKPEQQIGTEGIIKEIKMVDSRTGEVTFHQDEPFNNLITDVGLELLHTDGAGGDIEVMSGMDSYDALLLGSGNTPPQVTDTSLENQLGTGDSRPSQNINHSFDNSPYYFEVETEWRFDAGTATGTIRELGLQSRQATPNNNDLFARALIKDNQGNPIEIVKEDFNILFVTYAVRFYVDPVPDYTTTINDSITGTTYNVTLTVASVGVSSGVADSDKFWGYFTWLWGDYWFILNTDETTPPSPGTQEWTDVKFGNVNFGGFTNGSGLQQNGGSVRRGTDTNGLYVELYTEISISRANYSNGISTVFVGAQNGFGYSVSCPYAVHYDPPIPKTSNDKLTLAIKLRFRRN